MEGEYQQALDLSLQHPTEGMHGYWLLLAAVQGHLGDQDAAEVAVQKVLEIFPGYDQVYPMEMEYWWWNQPAVTERMTEGLQKAGLFDQESQ